METHLDSLPGTAPSAPVSTRQAGRRWVRFVTRYLPLFLILLITLARGTLYVFSVPPWQHPDEPAHFERVRLTAELGRLPERTYVSLPARYEIANSMLRYNFWHDIQQPEFNDTSMSALGTSPLGIWATEQPPLYYLLAALWLRPWLGAPVETQLYTIRLLSVLMNMLLVAATYLAARQIFGNRQWLVIGVVAFVVFQPMHTDIMSAVNNDALVNMLSASFFAVVASIYQRGLSWRNGSLALVLVIAALFTKTTAVVLVVALGAGIMIYLWHNWRTGLAVLALVVSGGVLLVTGLIMWHQLAPQQFGQVVAGIGRYFRIDVASTLKNFVSMDRLTTYRSSAITVFNSFWAAFGWRHIVLTQGWYQLLGLASIVALVGLVWQGVRWLGRGISVTNSVHARYVLFSLICVGMAWLNAIIRSQAEQGLPNIYLSHGRYVFVAMVPFALLFTLGWLGGVTERWRRLSLIVYVSAALAFDAICFWVFLVPYYACCRVA